MHAVHSKLHSDNLFLLSNNNFLAEMNGIEIILPLLVFILLCLAALCDCFATTEKVANYADALIGTRFHDTITKEAICKVQYDWLFRNLQNTKLKAPQTLMYEPCNYAQWGLTLQKSFLLAQTAMEIMAQASVVADIKPSTKSDPLYHFDSDIFIQKTNDRLIEERKHILRVFQGPNSVDNDLRESIGSSLHTLQDFYSHTNWIEMKKTKPNPNIAINSDLGIPIAPPNMPTCSDCKQNLTAAQKKNVSNWESTITNNILELLGMDFNASNVYICYDNILDTGHLTSGYSGNEEKVAPKIAAQMKCSHGGGIDSSVHIKATGGINKDTHTFLFSPHYYLHYAAADVAVLATVDYLERLRIDGQDERKFARLIGLIT